VNCGSRANWIRWFCGGRDELIDGGIEDAVAVVGHAVRRIAFALKRLDAARQAANLVRVAGVSASQRQAFAT